MWVANCIIYGNQEQKSIAQIITVETYLRDCQFCIIS